MVAAEGRVPEIFRIVVPADAKGVFGRVGVAGEGHRKPDLHRRAVGPRSGALELECLGGGDTGGAKRCGVGFDVGAFEQQSGQPLVPLQERLVEAAELHRQGIAAKLLRLRHREQLDEAAGELDDVVVRTPRMPIARADREAEPAIKRGGGIEVAH